MLLAAAAVAAKALHNRSYGKPTFLLHGNYTGPGNPVSRAYRAARPPVDALDRASLKHDLQYTSLLKRGINPYFKFNKADARYLERIDRLPGFSARLARGAFKAKRALSRVWGTLPTSPRPLPPKPSGSSPKFSNPDTPSGGDHTVNQHRYLVTQKTWWFKTYASKRKRRKRRRLW